MRARKKKGNKSVVVKPTFIIDVPLRDVLFICFFRNKNQVDGAREPRLSPVVVQLQM